MRYSGEYYLVKTIEWILENLSLLIIFVNLFPSNEGRETEAWTKTFDK